MSRSVGRTARVLMTLVGVVLMGSGATKLAGESHQVASFVAWGLPSWFRHLVGVFEIAGGGLLIAPSTAPIGGLILGTIMIGALWTHVVHQEWPHVVPVGVVMALLAWILQHTRGRAIRLLGGSSLC